MIFHFFVQKVSSYLGLMNAVSLIHNKHFLLSKHQTESWKEALHMTIGTYQLYYHPNLHCTFHSDKNKSLILLGDLYDYTHPELTNKEIIKRLFQLDNIWKLLIGMNLYCGDYIVIFAHKQELYIFNDACAQKEIYYTTDYKHFGSQPKIFQHVITSENIKDKEAIRFFSSSWFKQRKYYVGYQTHRENIHHLLPNHYIDLYKKKVFRFFPLKTKAEMSIDETVSKVKAMLNGYLMAISKRYPIALPLTAGYDSRLLFAMSLNIECKYYIYKHWKITDIHKDVIIAKKLARTCRKEIQVIKYNNTFTKDLKELYENSFDFYHRRFALLTFQGELNHFPNHVIINGNIGEVARNYYGNLTRISDKILAYFQNTYPYLYTRNLYRDWLKNSKDVIEANGYNIYDFFYWEEKMGNWGAKRKSEFSFGMEIVSPFNSRELLMSMSACHHKYRDYHQHELYDRILESIHPEFLNIPVNPGHKRKRIITLKKLGLYTSYKTIVIFSKIFLIYPLKHLLYKIFHKK